MPTLKDFTAGVYVNETRVSEYVGKRGVPGYYADADDKKTVFIEAQPGRGFYFEYEVHEGFGGQGFGSLALLVKCNGKNIKSGGEYLLHCENDDQSNALLGTYDEDLNVVEAFSLKEEITSEDYKAWRENTRRTRGNMHPKGKCIELDVRRVRKVLEHTADGVSHEVEWIDDLDQAPYLRLRLIMMSKDLINHLRLVVSADGMTPDLTSAATTRDFTLASSPGSLEDQGITEDLDQFHQATHLSESTPSHPAASRGGQPANRASTRNSSVPSGSMSRQVKTEDSQTSTVNDQELGRLKLKINERRKEMGELEPEIAEQEKELTINQASINAAQDNSFSEAAMFKKRREEMSRDFRGTKADLRAVK